MRLTDDELRDVLARAEEIQRASRHDEEMNAELEAVIGAAEEVGLARPAVERALRERLAVAAARKPDASGPRARVYATVIGRAPLWARSSGRSRLC